MILEKLANLVLSNPIIYWSYQGLVGGHKARKRFIHKDINPKPNINLLDIGCGPGNMITYLPKLNYLGIDIDKNYIEAARKKYGHQAKFICSNIEDLEISKPGTYDLVIAFGIVHHLDDTAAERLFEVAKTALKPGGRLLTADGCFTEKQNKIAKWLLHKDRGEFVRWLPEYETLAKSQFENINYKIEHSYFNVPYSLLIMECYKSVDIA